MLYHLPAVFLTLVVALPVGNPGLVALWGAITLLLVLFERVLSTNAKAARLLPPIIVSVLISAAYALAGLYLIFGPQGGGVRMFAAVLLISSMIIQLLRHYLRLSAFILSIAPQALVFGAMTLRTALSQVTAGNFAQALAPFCVIALFVLLFWAARSQLVWSHQALIKVQQLALDREAAAVAANRAKTEFLATVSHEIRTPLNGVLGMAQVMSADEHDAVQRDRLTIIRSCGETLLAIVDDILDLSKIEAGKLELDITDFELEETVGGAIGVFTPLAFRKHLGFQFQIDEDAKGAYRGDPVRLKQILHNLISNAVKFTDAGDVRVRLSYADGALVIAVADTGIGIAPDQVERLFGKFVQADGSNTRRFGGTGLGLSICRELAQAMGGDITVASEPGVGSTFTARLPVKRVAPAVKSTTAPAAHIVAPGELRVLAAEDNDVNQEVLRTLLQNLGIEPVLVANGAEALAAYEREPWDVVLMDIQMPELDGLQATKAIRDHETATGRARTPIVAVTANAMNYQAEQYIAAGMDGLVPKPIRAATLRDAIEQALEESAKNDDTEAA